MTAVNAERLVDCGSGRVDCPSRIVPTACYLGRGLAGQDIKGNRHLSLIEPAAQQRVAGSLS